MGWKREKLFTHFRFAKDTAWKNRTGGRGRYQTVTRLICSWSLCVEVKRTKLLRATARVTCPRCRLVQDVWLERGLSTKPATIRRLTPLLTELKLR